MTIRRTPLLAAMLTLLAIAGAQASTAEPPFFAPYRAHTAAFATTGEAVWLEQAAEALTRIDPAGKPQPEARRKVLDLTLGAWLELLATLDRTIDPAFDAANPPSKNVIPPATADGVRFPPGGRPRRDP